jgi:predicted component of type VI protein secretion system
MLRTAALLHPYAWGVGTLQVDRDALANDTLRLLELSLRFPDGEQYSAVTKWITTMRRRRRASASSTRCRRR